MSSAPKQRPKYYDLNLAHLPPPGLVSILHRVSGLALFFPILPAVLFLLGEVVSSQQGYDDWRGFISRPLVKVAMLGVTWLYAHHFWAGLRYLALDMHWGIAKAPARASAVAVLLLGAVTTILVGWRLW
ncbi:MAG: succinate dehydrogenase, cytochrome b556 subunit [Usitatibacter sp.]